MIHLLLFGALLIPPTDNLAQDIRTAQMGYCGGEDSGRAGCKIVLQEGVYESPAPVRLCRSLIIEGEGGSFDGNTTIAFTSTTSGFIAHTEEECEELGYGDGSGVGEAHLRDLYVIKTVPTSTSDRSVGVRADRPVHLNNVGVENFMQGIRGSCVVGSNGEPKETFERGTKTNCNGSSLINVRVTRSGHAALWIQDKDANGFVIQNLQHTDNCRLASQLPAEMGECGSVVERSFLGSTYIGGVGSTANGSPQIIAEGDSNPSVFVGTYFESNNGEQTFDKFMTVIGGRNTFEGPGLSIQGPLVSGMCDLASTFCFGNRATGTGTVAMMKFVLDGKNYYVRFKGKLLGGEPHMVVDVNNRNAERILDVTLKPPQTVRFYQPIVEP